MHGIAEKLRAAGLSVFLDQWYMIPGVSWQNELEQKISQSKSACVFVGPNGFGSWQQREKNLALDKQAGESTYRVIPVILPGNNDPTLGFLGLNTWIDLRKEANTDLLVKAIHSTRHTHQRRNGNRTH